MVCPAKRVNVNASRVSPLSLSTCPLIVFAPTPRVRRVGAVGAPKSIPAIL